MVSRCWESTCDSPTQYKSKDRQSWSPVQYGKVWEGSGGVWEGLETETGSGDKDWDSEV